MSVEDSLTRGRWHDDFEAFDAELSSKPSLPGTLQELQSLQIANRDDFPAVLIQQLFNQQQFAAVPHHLVRLTAFGRPLVRPNLHEDRFVAIDESVETDILVDLWLTPKLNT